MSATPPTTRRDRRVRVPRGTATVHFEREEAELRTIAAAGLAFHLKGHAAIDAGTTLESVTVRVGECVIRGDLMVRDSLRRNDGGFEVGCLFYPATPADSGRWLEFVAGRLNDSSVATPHLAIRCSNCHDSIWVCKNSSSASRCATCSQEYRFGNRLRGSQLDDLHQRACGMARELEIDLASAVSMLLGLVTLTDVRDVLGHVPVEDQETTAPNDGRRRPFDPAFIPAVEAGTLSRTQATQRGDRGSYANRLVDRHRISLEDALAVADNRTSLLLVLRKRKGKASVEVRFPVATTFGLLTVVTLFLLFVLQAMIGVLDRSDRVHGSPTAVRGPVAHGSPSTGAAVLAAHLPTPSPPEVELDAAARPTRITASRPQAVLQAFCQLPERQAVSLASGLARDPNLWLGVFKDRADPATPHAIAIRKNRTTGRWTAGDGNAPIRIMSPDRGHLGETRPVSAEGTR